MELRRGDEEGVTLVEEEMLVRVVFLIEASLVLGQLREVQEVVEGADCRLEGGVEARNKQKESTRVLAQAKIGNENFDVGQSKTMLADQNSIQSPRQENRKQVPDRARFRLIFWQCLGLHMDNLHTSHSLQVYMYHASNDTSMNWTNSSGALVVWYRRCSVHDPPRVLVRELVELLQVFRQITCPAKPATTSITTGIQGANIYVLPVQPAFMKSQ